MSGFRVRIDKRAVAALVILAIAIGATPTFAQSSTTSTISSTAEEVKNWTQKQWNAAKKEWRKDKAKWSACRQKAHDQKLSGKASWSFLYTCMKS
jgi:hypothetical protein